VTSILHPLLDFVHEVHASQWPQEYPPPWQSLPLKLRHLTNLVLTHASFQEFDLMRNTFTSLSHTLKALSLYNCNLVKGGSDTLAALRTPAQSITPEFPLALRDLAAETSHAHDNFLPIIIPWLSISSAVRSLRALAFWFRYSDKELLAQVFTLISHPKCALESFNLSLSQHDQGQIYAHERAFV
jgi:hypothetical protein